MSRSKIREKWFKVLCRATANCPNCGSADLKEGYVVSNIDPDYGYGAVWCENCRNGIWISRVILKGDEARAKIISELPSDLKLF